MHVEILEILYLDTCFNILLKRFSLSLIKIIRYYANSESEMLFLINKN